MITLAGIRLGHANNSSSTHTLLFDKNRFDRSIDEEGYGWESFVLASENAKKDYLISQTLYALYKVPKWISDIIISAIFGVDISSRSEDKYIDHNSVWQLPYDFGTNFVSKEFLKDLCDYVLQKGLAVLGGNNNDGEYQPGFFLPIERDVSHKYHSYCRKDSITGYWTVYDARTGNKIRFKFEPGIEPKLELNPSRPSTPELIDIKITDMCMKQCPYCYQGASINGKHADYGILYNLSNDIADMKVFEVAIGGGEPTLHPNFVDILDIFKTKGITPNFTTASLEWLNDSKKAAKIIDTIGSFAYTPHRKNEYDFPSMLQLLKILDAYITLLGIENSEYKVSINIPMGTLSEYEFEVLMKTIFKYNLRATLLGYKNTERGATYKMTPYPWAIKVIKKLEQEYRCPSIGVDSVFLEQFRQSIVKKINGEEIIMVREDGKFSMYIDAVAMTTGPNSYCDKTIMKQFKTYNNELTPIFQSFNDKSHA